jgi:Glycosyl hydrolases family 32 C terminal
MFNVDDTGPQNDSAYFCKVWVTMLEPSCHAHLQNLDWGAQMRVFLDHSCVEVYLSTGEVLSTRVYRGVPPPNADAGIDLIAYGGTARMERLEAWEMGSIWRSPAAAPSNTVGPILETLRMAMPLPSVVAA